VNPVLFFLIIVGAILLWIICSFVFKPIGKFINRVFANVKSSMLEEEIETKETKNNKGE
jgi:F0F1-type ATP synthase membrane subunit b/b'